MLLGSLPPTLPPPPTAFSSPQSKRFLAVSQRELSLDVDSPLEMQCHTTSRHCGRASAAADCREHASTAWRPPRCPGDTPRLTACLRTSAVPHHLRARLRHFEDQLQRWCMPSRLWAALSVLALLRGVCACAHAVAVAGALGVRVFCCTCSVSTGWMHP